MPHKALQDRVGYGRCTDMRAVSLRSRMEETSARWLDAATITLGYEDILPVRDRLASKRPQILRNRTELVIVYRHVQTPLRQRHRCGSQLCCVINRIDPKVSEVDVRVAEHFETHQCDMRYERKVPVNVFGELGQATIGLL